MRVENNTIATVAVLMVIIALFGTFAVINKARESQGITGKLIYSERVSLDIASNQENYWYREVISDAETRYYAEIRGLGWITFSNPNGNKISVSIELDEKTARRVDTTEFVLLPGQGNTASFGGEDSFEKAKVKIIVKKI